jgi:hypothetical protein
MNSDSLTDTIVLCELHLSGEYRSHHKKYLDISYACLIICSEACIYLPEEAQAGSVITLHSWGAFMGCDKSDGQVIACGRIAAAMRWCINYRQVGKPVSCIGTRCQGCRRWVRVSTAVSVQLNRLQPGRLGGGIWHDVDIAGIRNWKI